MRQFKTLVDGLCFGEGPRWHKDQLWYSDFYLHTVHRTDMSGHVTTVCELPNQPSGLGWTPDDRLLVVSMLDRKLMRLDPDGLKTHADLSGLAAFWCNDMVTDSRGRSYVGNFGYDLMHGEAPKPAELILVDLDGKARVVARDLIFPNGTVITPDGKTLIIGESFVNRLTAFDIAADGSLSNRRLWAQTGEATPDGISLDAEGAIWMASPMSAEVLRVREGGEVLERFKPSQPPYAVMLGGADRKTLFVVTAPTADPEESKKLSGGRIEMTPVEVPGIGLP
ncbi:MAG: SMP-30/gluconolactonase/LRE family protein [Candidatus Binataceae bacterium]|nr:SMP-30/gluconolactonase/LRE family protein [Candidatus Binataceae bacterium]